MTNGIPLLIDPEEAPLPVLPDGMPIFYEDEDEGDMGDANLHTLGEGILLYGLTAHLSNRPRYRVFANLNLHYRDGPPHPYTGAAPYVSPDLMALRPRRRLPADVASYTIGRDGPGPVLVGEVLSRRSAQQRDLREKLRIYALLGIAEYILADVTGRFLRERLVVKRLRRNGSWKDEQDPDGGITSRLGFRVVIEADGQLRMLDARTGKRYLRPSEAQAAADAREFAETRVRELEAELARLRLASEDIEKTTKRRRKT